jgi:hypothetical protein
MSLTVFFSDHLIIKWFMMIHRCFSLWLKWREGKFSVCIVRFTCADEGCEAFCRNINFPFFTLMFAAFVKIENQKQHWKGRSGKFKGSTFFFYLLWCLPGALLDEKKVYVCPLFMINIKKGVRRPINKRRQNFPIYTFPTFSTSIFYNFRCYST